MSYFEMQIDEDATEPRLMPKRKEKNRKFSFDVSKCSSVIG